MSWTPEEWALHLQFCEAAISLAQFSNAKSLAAASGKPLRDVIVELGSSSAVIGELLSTYLAPCCLLEFFPVSTAREHLLIPLTLANDGAFILAVNEFTTVEILETLQTVTHRTFRVVLASREELIAAIDRDYANCESVDSVDCVLPMFDPDPDTDSPSNSFDTP